MPRRGGRERYRSAKQVPAPVMLHMHDPTSDAFSRRVVARDAYTPPAWMVKDAKVHYHGIIGQAVTKPDCVIAVDPWNQPGSGWVTIIDKVRGWVACEALSKAA